MSELLARLGRWYESQCNDDWEHHYGIRIDTLDNPGWSLEIDLTDTSLIGREFAEVAVERTERDWMRCRIADKRFEAFGGPGNLPEMLSVFLLWAESPE